MNRRGFIRGLSVMALASKLSFADPGPVLNNIAHPEPNNLYQTYSDAMGKALADSMLQTKEITMAQVYDNAELANYTHQIFGTKVWLTKEPI